MAVGKRQDNTACVAKKLRRRLKHPFNARCHSQNRPSETASLDLASGSFTDGPTALARGFRDNKRIAMGRVGGRWWWQPAALGAAATTGAEARMAPLRAGSEKRERWDDET